MTTTGLRHKKSQSNNFSSSFTNTKSQNPIKNALSRDDLLIHQSENLSFLSKLSLTNWSALTATSEHVGKTHTPHIQRKSLHFLFSFPLLSPACFLIFDHIFNSWFDRDFSADPLTFASLREIHLVDYLDLSEQI